MLLGKTRLRRSLVWRYTTTIKGYEKYDGRKRRRGHDGSRLLDGN
jgi:hypothetical protein